MSEEFDINRVKVAIRQNIGQYSDLKLVLESALDWEIKALCAATIERVQNIQGKIMALQEMIDLLTPDEVQSS